MASSSLPTLILSRSDVARLLPHHEVVGLVETVFREWGEGAIVMPPKVNLDMSRSGFDSWSNAMPAFLVSPRIAGIKWAGGYGGNGAKGFPYIRGIVVVTDPETGGTLAVMDGGYISDWRTGASAAVAAKHLAPPTARRVALIGAGAQGRTAAVCLGQALPGARLVVHDLSPARRAALRRDLAEHFGLELAEADSAAAAIEGSDVVVLLTTAKEPFVRAEWIGEGCLTLAMGSYQQADDAVTLGADRIIVDSWSQAAHRGELKPLAEAGRVSAGRIHAELGQVVAGKKAGRQDPRERILAVLVGLGAHDVFIAGQVQRRAAARRVGIPVSLDS